MSGFTPSTLSHGTYVIATCARPGCGGGRMTIELASVAASETEARGGWPKLPGLP